MQELTYLGHMRTYLRHSLRQFVLGALEFPAPVLHLDRVNGIHPARIEPYRVSRRPVGLSQTDVV
jgi:hypothetical protein